MTNSSENAAQQAHTSNSLKVSSRKNALVKKVFRFSEGMFAVTGVLFVIYHAGFSVSTIYSDSMAPTLKGENTSTPDVVLTERISYWFRKPRRWEVVKYHTQGDLRLEVMKRVAALPGETISIKDQWILINGELVDRPARLDFLKYYEYGYLRRGKEVHCEDGYFVLGDYSKDSADSRFDGTISFDRLEGRTWLIIWPLSRLGRVNP